MRRFFLIVAAGLVPLLFGCIDVVPPEATVAGALLEKAVAANEQTRGILVESYVADVTAMFDAQLDMIQAREFAKINALTAPAEREAKYALLLAAIQEKRTTHRAELEAKRREFLDDPNLEAARALAGSLNRYVQPLDRTARELAGIIEDGKALIGPI